MMWALMSFNYELERNDMFFDEATAKRIYSLGLLYVQLHTMCAKDCLAEHRPRWKVRARMHSFLCECLCKLANGSKMNPKHFSCWSDEDYIGQSCAIGKARSIHATTIGLRLLQRLCLVLNAELAGPENEGERSQCRGSPLSLSPARSLTVQINLCRDSIQTSIRFFSLFKINSSYLSTFFLPIFTDRYTISFQDHFFFSSLNFLYIYIYICIVYIYIHIYVSSFVYIR